MRKTEIRKASYLGWPNTWYLSNGIIEARVVTDIGPRIIDFRLVGGKNLLYIRSEEAGRVGETAWVFRGGWRLWVAPERKETTYALDNGPCSTEVAGNTLRVSAPDQPEAGIRKQVDVTLLPGEAVLHIQSKITNVSNRPLTYALWSLPVLRPGGRAFIPLDPGPPEALDAVRSYFLWSYSRMNDPRYSLGDKLIEIDHAKVKAPIVSGPGRRDDESKIGSDSGVGWAAYLTEGTLFVKRFPVTRGMAYPDGGARVEVYSNAEFLELENLGPLAPIAPGESASLDEEWRLLDRVDVPPGEKAAHGALLRVLGALEPLPGG